MKIQIKNILGKVLFEYDKEDNTIRDTVIKAVKQGVSLKFANLHEEYLGNADIRGADLYGADIASANLEGVNLSGANLVNADLRHTNLRNANLRLADLRKTDFSYATLKNVNLSFANLYGADFSYAKNIPYIPLTCPSEGSFIGWKKITHYKEDYKGVYIVKLLIPEEAKRSSATTNKCRCNKAKVLEITNVNNGNTVDIITNTNIIPCVYKVGEYVYPDSFDENRWNECSNGIHFFINKQEAIDYY